MLATSTTTPQTEQSLNRTNLQTAIASQRGSDDLDKKTLDRQVTSVGATKTRADPVGFHAFFLCPT
jgi:hypothetical protein